MPEEEVVVQKQKLRKLKAPHWMQGFVDFIRQQGVVGVAVGFILGVASKAVIDSIVNNIVNPIVGLYGAGGSLVDKYWCIKTVNGVCTNKIGYGAVINQVINFLIVAFTVYLIIKLLKLDKFDKKKE